MNKLFIFRNKKIILLFFSLIIFFVMGWFANDNLSSTKKEPATYPVREDLGQYKFINPLILLDNSSITYEKLDPLKIKVEEYIDKKIKDLQAERISFYFRDLDSGMWTGVYPDEKFIPASLLKVMTMIVYLRTTEDDPNTMNKKLFYKKHPTKIRNILLDQNLQMDITVSEGLSIKL